MKKEYFPKYLLFSFFIISVAVSMSRCSWESETSEKPPPNILWIVTEDISPALGCYGDDYAKTPNLDSFAARAIRYDYAYATAPICAPSRSCLITGLYATSLGTQHLRTEVKKPDFIKTFPVYLKESGYFVTNYGKTDYNFDPTGIWDYWEQDPFPWRKRNGDQPFFSFLNIGSTHEGPGNNEDAYQRAVEDLPDSLFHDPDKANLPPYFPDTPEMRRIWAHYYDLVSDMDVEAGKILDALREDGLMENTIIFFFSDHGFGLPRYKRWLYSTGLQVPLIIYLPPAYQHFSKTRAGNSSDDMISFVDFAPTVLNLAGIEPPGYMQGKKFLGDSVDRPRKYVYGARSRADDMYEISRAVLARDYIYIRHYLPYLPYIQPGYIFSDSKISFRELRKLYLANELPDETLKLWQHKPVEELYNLKNDPFELNNLARDRNYREIRDYLHEQLKSWIIETRDVGFLFEPEYRIRAEDTTTYEMAQDSSRYDIGKILAAAELVGMGSIPEIEEAIHSDDSGVRFWGVTALRNDLAAAEKSIALLEGLLEDPSPVVQIAAAETLCAADHCENALAVLDHWVQDDRPWLALYAARSLQLIGDKACPLVPTMHKVLEKNIRDPQAASAGSRYLDFNFSAFTSWALEVALVNCGEDVLVNAGN
ncbi:MAG: sulfatase-like hydrolase/transferase [Cyclobacteriaceae bacterium]|nr:sulfatase-like hydrolase/transferase [Cyclobacteriaceae bacterium]